MGDLSVAPETAGKGINWHSLAIWLAMILMGLLQWVGNRELETVEKNFADSAFRVQAVELKASNSHDDLTRLKEIVPRIEQQLDKLQRQNEEILRELRKR